MGSIKITLNGQETNIKTTNLNELVTVDLGLNIDHIIIEHNQTIIPKKTIPNITLNNNDNVEIIRYIGGGS